MSEKELWNNFINSLSETISLSLKLKNHEIRNEFYVWKKTEHDFESQSEKSKEFLKSFIKCLTLKKRIDQE
jgi:hypothetical protein